MKDDHLNQIENLKGDHDNKENELKKVLAELETFKTLIENVKKDENEKFKNKEKELSDTINELNKLKSEHIAEIEKINEESQSNKQNEVNKILTDIENLKQDHLKQIDEIKLDKHNKESELNSLLQNVENENENKLTNLRNELKMSNEENEKLNKSLINLKSEIEVENNEKITNYEEELEKSRQLSTKLTSSLVEKDSILSEKEERINSLIERLEIENANEGFGQVHVAKRMEEYVELKDIVQDQKMVINKQSNEISKLKARPLPQPNSQSLQKSSPRATSENINVRRLFDRASSPNLRASSTPLIKSNDKENDEEIDRLNDVVRSQRSQISDLRKNINDWRNVR